MNRSFARIIDLDEFLILKNINVNSQSVIATAKKKSSCSKLYILKRFNYNCNNERAQQILMPAFCKLRNQKNQYLQSYSGFSFFYKSNINPTISMKYISSVTLEKLLIKPYLIKKWEFPDIMRCLFAVAKGLSYLHDNLFFHGNLCPSNIIVDDAKQCYLCDFGLFQIKKLFYPSKIIFNNVYKDPSMNENNPTAVNDVYSYGVLICQLCLSHFQSENDVSLKVFLNKNDPKKFEIFPPFFQELIPACLNPDITKRPTMQQVIDRFDHTRYAIEKFHVKDLFKKFVESNYLINLANAKNSIALNKLGKMYEKGKYFQEDYQKALECYKEATKYKIDNEYVNSEAFANYGSLLQKISEKNSEEMKEGANFLKQSAEEGDALGIAKYGMALNEGNGVEVDIQKAEEFLKKAAELNNSFAQANYGFLLIKNNPTEERVRDGLKFIKDAIIQSDPDANYLYGVILQQGVVLPKNDTYAMNYFKIAADMGNEKAMVKYADYLMKGNIVPKNINLAFNLYQRAMEKGNMEAEERINSFNTSQKKSSAATKSNKNSSTKKNKEKSESKESVSNKKNDKKIFYNESLLDLFYDENDTPDPPEEQNESKPDPPEEQNKSKPDPPEEQNKSKPDPPEKQNESKSDPPEEQNKSKSDPPEEQNKSKSDPPEKQVHTNDSSTKNTSNVQVANNEISSSSKNKSKNQDEESKESELKAPNKDDEVLMKSENSQNSIKTDESTSTINKPQTEINNTQSNSNESQNQQNEQINSNETVKTPSTSNNKDKKSSHDFSSSSYSDLSDSFLEDDESDDNSNTDQTSVTSNQSDSTNNSNQNNIESSLFPMPKPIPSTIIKFKLITKQSKTTATNKPTSTLQTNNINTQLVQSTINKPANQPTSSSKTNKINTHPPSSTMNKLTFQLTPTQVANINQNSPLTIIQQNYNTATKNKTIPTVTIDPLKLDENKPPFNQYTASDTVLSVFKALRDGSHDMKYSEEQRNKLKRILYKYEPSFINTHNARVIYKFAKLYDEIKDTKKAMKYYKIAADFGHPKAQSTYGVALQKGKEVPLDTDLGFKYLSKSAQNGDLNGLSNYGLALYHGDGTTKNEAEGLKYLKRAADEGYVFAQLQFGIYAKNPIIGHQYIEKAAEANYKKAIIYYASDFMEGRGVAQDYNRAKDILQNLYEVEYKTKVLIKLVECLKHIDYKEALNYMKILADLDDKAEAYPKEIHEARYQYGLELFYGNHIQKNIRKALFYLSESDHLAIIRSEHSDIYKLMPHDFTSVEKKVKSFIFRNGTIDKEASSIIRSAYKGNADDTLKAAKMLQSYGDYKTANFFYEIAADSNQSEAALIIGKHYLAGKYGLIANESKGKKYIHKSADLGYIPGRLEVIKYQMKLVFNKPKKQNLVNDLFTELNELASTNFIPAIIYKAELLIKKNSFEEAKSELNKARILAQNDEKLLFKIGKLYMHMGEIEIGFQIIKPYEDTNNSAVYYLGRYYCEIKDFEKAEEYFTKAAERKIKDSTRFLSQCKIQLNKERRELNKIMKQQQSTTSSSPIKAQASIEAAPASSTTTNTEQNQQKIETTPENINLDQNQQIPIDFATNYINTDLKPSELIQKGDEFLKMNIIEDAIQCYDIAINKGDPVAYFKRAKLCDDFQKKLDYYEFAVINKVDGALSEWRKCIYNHISQVRNKQVISNFAQRFERLEDYSDASVLYYRIKDIQNFNTCYEKAKQNISDIQDGHQQYDFGVLAQKQKETDLALTMYQKASENGIKEAKKNIKELTKINQSSNQHLESLFIKGKEMYLKSSTEEERKNAIAYLKDVADKNYPDAMYFYSKIIEKSNPLESTTYFKSSIDKGSELAIKEYGKQLKEDDKLNQAAELYKNAADKGLLIGYRKYAKYINKELNDYDLARKYYKKAADLGDAKDKFNYAFFLMQFFSDNTKDERARYFKKSAEKGCVNAFFYYAECLCNGDGIKKDLNEAKKYYTQSFLNDPDSPAKLILKSLKDQNLIDV